MHLRYMRLLSSGALIQKLIAVSFAGGGVILAGEVTRTHHFLRVPAIIIFVISDAAKAGDTEGSNWGDVAPSSFWINLS